MIAIKCSCGKRIQVGDEAAGKKVRCPACKSVLPVPAGNAPEVPVAPMAHPAQRGKRGGRAPVAEAAPELVPCAHCSRPITAGALQCPHCGTVTISVLDQKPARRGFRIDLGGQVTRLVWIVVLIVGGWAAWKYGNQFYEWVILQARWKEVASALEDDPLQGDTRLWKTIELTDELGPDLEPLVLDLLSTAKSSVVEQRCYELLAYAATRFPLSDASVEAFGEGFESVNSRSKLWSLKGLALAGAGESALRCLLPFTGSRKIEFLHRERSEAAARKLKSCEPTTGDAEVDRILMASRVLVGDTQALAFAKAMLEPVGGRGHIRELLFKLTGRTFEDPEAFAAWWEGEDGAYQRWRPDWLIEALLSEPQEKQLGIIQQLRALSGENFNFNHAAPKEEKARVIQSWKNWWDKERPRWKG